MGGGDGGGRDGDGDGGGGEGGGRGFGGKGGGGEGGGLDGASGGGDGRLNEWTSVNGRVRRRATFPTTGEAKSSSSSPWPLPEGSIRLS